MSLLISPSQCRAARALLNWSQPDLALRCDMHVQTISSFENETSTPTRRTLEKLASVIASCGIELLPMDGVARQHKGIKTYRGKDEFEAFFWDVYETVLHERAEVCISNVNESMFEDYASEKGSSAYVQKITALAKERSFKFKCLLREGDTNFLCYEYCDYKWMKAKYFHNAPFYVYGDKLALIVFGEEVFVQVVQDADIAKAQRIQFNYIWDHAIDPPKG